MNNQSADFGSIWQQLRLVWRLMRDPETPFWLKLLPVGALLYFVFPEGFAFLPLITPIDDAAIFYVALQTFLRLAPPHLITKHQELMSGKVVDGQIIEPSEKEIKEHIRINPDR